MYKHHNTGFCHLVYHSKSFVSLHAMHQHFCYLGLSQFQSATTEFMFLTNTCRTIQDQEAPGEARGAGETRSSGEVRASQETRARDFQLIKVPKTAVCVLSLLIKKLRTLSWTCGQHAPNFIIKFLWFCPVFCCMCYAYNSSPLDVIK